MSEVIIQIFEVHTQISEVHASIFEAYTQMYEVHIQMSPTSSERESTRNLLSAYSSFVRKNMVS